MNSNCHLDGEKEYEEISINYFRNKLIQKKKLRLAAIEFNELPKKIKRYIEFYYKSKVRNFLLNFPDKFIVDTDEDSVSLALQHYHHSNDDTVNLSEEKSSTDLIAEDNSDKGRSNLIESNNNSIKIDVEVQQALNYLNCIIFFVDVLKEINQPLLADKLGGYLSQAGSEIKEYIKLNYLKFKYFINDAPLIFLKNDLGELSLSKDYKNRIHFTKRIIYAAQAGSLPASELSLKSQINLILQPQIILSQEKQANKHIIDYFTETAKCKSIKESLNCFKSNSLSSDFDISEANQNINEEAHLILNYQFSNQDENEWDTTQNKKEMEFFCDALFKCFFTVQLYCLEFVESEMNFNKIYEYKAVKYFVKLLDTQSTKALRWTRLQGSLGNDTEIANFMNKMYKGDKFLSFFQNHPEFEISLPFIKLVFADILNTSDGLESFLPKKKSLNDFMNIYESHDYQYLVTEVFEFLVEVALFFIDKEEIKIERITGLLSKFPNCKYMIKSSKGQLFTEKLENFLRHVAFFNFLDKEVFFINKFYKKNYELIALLMEKVQDSAIENLSVSSLEEEFFETLSNILNKICEASIKDDYYWCVIDTIKCAIENEDEMHYYRIAQIMPISILIAIARNNDDCMFIIRSVFKSEQFILENGKINYKTDPSISINNCLQTNLSVSLDTINSAEDKITNYHTNCDLHESSQQNTFDNISNHLFPLNNNNTELINNFEMSDTSNLSLNKVNKEIVLNEKENNNCTINEENSKIKSKLSIEEYFNPLLFSENQNINLMNENIPEIVKDSFCANLPLEEDTSKIIDCISLEIPASINQSDFISKKETSSITKECKEIFISSDKFNEHEGKRNCELHSSLHYSNEYEELDCSSTLQHHESKEFTDKNKSYAFECDNIEVPESELEIAEYKIIPAVIELSENKKIPSSSNNSSLDTIEVRPSCSIIEAVMTEINETENKTNCITEVEDTYNIADESSVVEFQLVKENNISIISKDEKKEYANILEETSISENNLNNKQNLESIPALLYTEDAGEKNQNQDEKLTLNEDENNCNENENKRIHSESDKSNKYFEKTIEPQTVDFAKMKIPFLIEHPVTTAPNITFINNSDSIVNGNTNNISEKFPKIHPEEPIEISVRDKMSPRNVTAEISHHVNMTYQQENITSCNKKISVLNETTEDTTVIKKDDEVFKYPMQPITAKIILLTYNSCIAVSVIEQHQQNIYFLKCAFLCDHQEDCLDCFNTLQIGDEVSCFVPPTEISNRIWIAFMVSKDNAEHYSEINKYTNLQKLGENVRNFPNTSVNIQSTSIQVQQSTPKLKKKSIFSCENKSSQTDLSGDIKLRKMIKNSTSQTNLISACTISTQTKMDTVTSTTQTESTDLEIPFHKNNMSQTSLTGNVKNVVEMKSVTCLANFMETKIKNSAECQTFSTGAIMMLDTYPL